MSRLATIPLKSMSIIAGTPRQMINKSCIILEETRPSILSLWRNDGRVNHADSMACIRLMGAEVLPTVREIGRSLGLNSSFEADPPVSLAATPAGGRVTSALATGADK